MQVDKLDRLVLVAFIVTAMAVIAGCGFAFGGTNEFQTTEITDEYELGFGYTEGEAEITLHWDVAGDQLDMERSGADIVTFGTDGSIVSQGQITANTMVLSVTPLAIDYGGTGAITASAARTSLGVAIGSDVQAYASALADVASAATTDGNFLVGNGTNFVAESGATAQASMGVGAIGLLDEVDLSTDVTGTLPATAVGTGLTDAQVSNTLTASYFVGSGSVSSAVDLATAEVYGVLPFENFLTDGDLVIEGSFSIDAVSQPDFAFSEKWADDAYDIAYYDSELYTTINASHKVQVLDLDGAQQREWTITGTGTQFYIYVSDVPEVYVSDFDNDIVYVTDTSGTPIRSFGSNGTGNGEFDGVTRIAQVQTTLPSTDLYVCDYNNHRVQRLTTAGVYVSEIDLTVYSGTNVDPKPTGIAILPDYPYTMWITGDNDGTDDNSIWAYDSGVFVYAKVIGYEVSAYEDVEIFDGYLYSLLSSGLITAYDLDDYSVIDTNIGAGSGDGYLLDPDGFAFSGNKVWIAEDTTNNRIQEFDIYNDTQVTITNSDPYGASILQVDGDISADGDLGLGGGISTGSAIASGAAVSAVTTVTAGTGVVATTGGVTADAGDLTATLGDIDAVAGAVCAGTTVTAGTGLVATTGGVTADAGDFTATLGDLVLTAGDADIEGNVDAEGWGDFAGALTVGGITTAGTTDAIPLILNRNSLAPGATAGIAFALDNDNLTPEQSNYGTISAEIVDSSDGAEEGKISITAMEAGASVECVTIEPGEYELSMIRQSASEGPALGFVALNDAAQEVIYGEMSAVILDDTDGSEDGAIIFQPMTAGSGGVAGGVMDTSLKMFGPVESGANLGAGALQGQLVANADSGGSGPGALVLYSPNGTAWYIFVEDDGTLKASSVLPTQNSDGNEVGGQS